MPVRAHVMRRHHAAHQHVDERRGLRGRVPAVDVERRIGFRDAARLHVGERALELGAALELRQDEVAGRVDDAAKAFDRDRRHRLAHEVEDRHAVHHRALEEEHAIDGFGQRFELVIRERRRSLVGGDDMRLAFERGAHVRRPRARRDRCRAPWSRCTPAGLPPLRRPSRRRPGGSRRCRCARAARDRGDRATGGLRRW